MRAALDTDPAVGIYRSEVDRRRARLRRERRREPDLPRLRRLDQDADASGRGPPPREDRAAALVGCAGELFVTAGACSCSCSSPGSCGGPTSPPTGSRTPDVQTLERRLRARGHRRRRRQRHAPAGRSARSAFAIVRIPRFGADYARPVLEGTDRRHPGHGGIGHYTGTARPGPGRQLRRSPATAPPTAGRSTTSTGSRAGDKIVVETRTAVPRV